MSIKHFVLYIVMIVELISVNIYSQAIEKGEIQYGIIDYTINDGEDSTAVKQLVEIMSTQMSQKILFDKNHFVSIKNVDGDTTKIIRTVFDIQNNLMYSFNEELKMYTIDTIKSIYDDIDIQKLQEQIEIVKEENLPEKLYGLTVKKVEIKNKISNTKLDLIVAPNVKMPKVSGGFDMGLGIEGLVMLTSMEIENSKINFGVTSFSTVISNDQYFSLSIEGYENGKEYIDIFKDIFSDGEGKEKFYGRGENLDLLKSIVEKKLIDSTCYFMKYELKDLIKDNASIDKLSILKELKKHGTNTINKSLESIISAIKENDLLSEEYLKELKIVLTTKPEISIKYFWDIVLASALKEHLSKDKTRKVILENHIKLGLIDSTESSSKTYYLEAKMNLSNLLASECDLLFPVIRGQSYSKDQTFFVTKAFFNTAIGDLMEDMKVFERNDTFVIETNLYNYFIPYNDLREYAYNSEYDADKGYSYADSIELNIDFYNKLLKTVKQIDADYDFPYAFAIYDFNEMFNVSLGVDEYNYQYIVSEFPKLKIESIDFAINRFLTEDYDIFETIPISFPFSPNSSDIQVRISSYKVGDIDGNAEYVTSKTKKEFIDLLLKSKSDFIIDDAKIDEIKKKIQNELILGNYSLFDYIPNFVYTYSFFSDSYLVSVSYNPYIDSLKNSFKEVFIDLYRFTDEYFNAVNLSFNNKTRELKFDYKSKNYTIPKANKMKVLETMAKILNNENKAKKVYSLDVGLGVTKYYYITDKQRVSMENLIGESYNYKLEIIK